MLISVIIPVLNEAGFIRPCLAQFVDEIDIEVVVVDGGSSDATMAIVGEYQHVRGVVSPTAGRASQMNYAVGHTTGLALLFLHADTRLPENGLQLIRQALVSEGVVGGRFKLALSERGIRFWLIGRLSTLRSRLFGITYGDQGIFVRRSVFEAVGGYPRMDLFEDSEFCKEVSRHGKFVTANGRVLSSTRRWRSWGILRTVTWMWALRILFTLGVSDKTLSRWYRAVR